MEGNGNGQTAAPPVVSEQVAAMAAQIQKLDEPLKLIIGTMIRGILTGSPGVDAAAVLNMISWHTGHYLARSINGDLAAVLQLRKGFKAAFEDGVNKAPVLQAAGGTAPGPAPGLPAG